MRTAWAVVAVMALLAGCGRGASPKTPPTDAPESAPVSAEGELYDRLGSGSYQASVALASIAKSLELARELERKLPAGDAKIAMEEVVDRINATGEAVSAFSEEPPPEKDVNADFGKYDDVRLKAIEALNDGLVDLREAVGIIESLSEDLTGMRQIDAEKTKSAALEAMDDVTGAIEGFGGAVIDEVGDSAGQPQEIR